MQGSLYIQNINSKAINSTQTFSTEGTLTLSKKQLE